jgi:predicted TIM-barrel fold metal-dependent hydrolase
MHMLPRVVGLSRRHLLIAILCLLLPTQTIVVSGKSISMSNTNSNSLTIIIDSHSHIWATAHEAASTFPYSGDAPPAALQNIASPAALLQHHMATAGVKGALIVQPANHKFDHSYVTQALRDYPGIFKGMLLHDPSLSTEDAIHRLENLALAGFNSVRFNPYLWQAGGTDPNTAMSSSEAGVAVYRRCAELHMPVGIMCFKGLHLHHRDILELIRQSPETVLVLDHFGFTGFTDVGNTNFQTLLSLAVYPKVYIKISALFRLNDEYPFDRVRQERFLPLLERFGKDRLMFGTDFPYALQHVDSYKTMVDLVSGWMETDEIRKAVMGGTAETVFGPWGVEIDTNGEL